MDLVETPDMPSETDIERTAQVLLGSVGNGPIPTIAEIHRQRGQRGCGRVGEAVPKFPQRGTDGVIAVIDGNNGTDIADRAQNRGPLVPLHEGFPLLAGEPIIAVEDDDQTPERGCALEE